tara:strand:- start:88 stop:684 length:597 start_codon:yes stop_codon:yes gene_type:complete
MRRFGPATPTTIRTDSVEGLAEILGYFSGAVQELEEPLRARYWNFFGLKPGEVVINELEFTGEDKFRLEVNPKRRGGRQAPATTHLGRCFSFLVGYQDVVYLLDYLDSNDNTFGLVRDGFEGLGHGPEFIRSLAQREIYDDELLFEIDKLTLDGDHYRVHLRPTLHHAAYSERDIALMIHRVFVENKRIIKVPRDDKT